MEKIKVIIYGCGVMGRKITQALLDKESFTPWGPINLAERKISPLILDVHLPSGW